MSELVYANDIVPKANLIYGKASKLGEFIFLECENHGTALCFTDSTGSDHCTECIKKGIEEVSDD